MNVAKCLSSMGLALVLIAGTAVPVHAQVQMRVNATAGSGGFGGEGQVPKRSVEHYTDILGFSPEQKDSALTIFDGYTAAFQEAQKAQRSAMQDLRRTAEDSGDNTVFMEKMPKIQTDFRDKTTKLEKGLFDDLKSLVSGPAQEQRWPKVERTRRREVGLRGGTVSGESVDLVDVVSGLKLPAEAMAPLANPLDEYETELDHQLQEKAKLASDAPKFEPGKPMDMEGMKKQMEAAREAGAKVKEVNDRSARKIEPLLPEDKRQAFRDAVRMRSFPQVYRPSRPVKDMDAAGKLGDLTAAQRSRIAEIRAGYQRDAAALNEAWAAAIQASEKDGSGGVMVDGLGGRMIMNFGDEPQPLVDARKARRELDEKTNDKLKGVLNEAQQEKVAKAATESDDEPTGAVRAIMIHSDTRDK